MSRFISLQNQRVAILISIFFILTGLGYFISQNNGNKVTTLTRRNQIPSKTTEDLSIAVIKSVSQLSDVQPKDKIYDELKNLIDNYNLMIAYADGKFRGDRFLNRYELVATLHSVVEQQKKIVAELTLSYATKEQIKTLSSLQKKLEADIAIVQNQLNTLKVNGSRADDLSGLLVNNQVLEQASAIPVRFNTGVTSQEGVSITQITSVKQLRDVKPSDLFFEALQNLVERYGISLIYPDGTFRGNHPLTRYEFATILNDGLQMISRLLQDTGKATKSEAESLISLQKALNLEIEILKTRLEQLKFQQARNNDYSYFRLVNKRNLEQASATNAQSNVEIMQKDKISQESITSVSQMPDVRDTHWAYPAIHSIAETGKVLPFDSDGVFKGNQAATRAEFVIILNVTLSEIEELDLVKNIPTKEDLSKFRKNQEALALKIGQLQERIEQLEARK